MGQYHVRLRTVDGENHRSVGFDKKGMTLEEIRETIMEQLGQKKVSNFYIRMSHGSRTFLKNNIVWIDFEEGA